MAKTKAPNLGSVARDLAAEHLKNDEDRTSAFPPLLRRKMDRMAVSPLAFLRGAAPLFYELLKEHSDLGDGPGGEGWIVGDLHLENFGAYRPDGFDDTQKGAVKRPAVFDLNDFDDTIVGPWRYDVLRFTTSLLLAGRELGVTGPIVLDLLDRALAAWSQAVFDDNKPSDLPACVAALVETVRSRSRTQLLDARTKESGGKRYFALGTRYAALDADILEQVPKAFDEYVTTIAKDERASKVSFDIEDSAFRIAGTGSLGGLRIAVLVAGKGGSHGQTIFDLKEQGIPSAATILGEPQMDPGERVVTGFRACVAHPPALLGTSHIRLGKNQISLSCRMLSPQEDKLNLPKLKAVELPDLATHLGGLLGAAHARGAKGRVKQWTKADCDLVRGQAVALAGIHEAVYLALCDRTRTL